MKLNTAFRFLLIVAFLALIVCLFLILAPSGKYLLAPSKWILLETASVLVLAAFAPLLYRRWKGLPEPKAPSLSDTRFAIVVVAVLCPFTFWAVWAGGAYGTLAIMLVPIAFLIRQGFVTASSINKRN